MPPPDPALGPAMVIATSVMRLVSLPLFGGRIYARVVSNWGLSWDSYFLTAAVLLDLVQWAFLLVSISHGYGHSYIYVSPEEGALAAKYLFLSQPFYIWTISCAKISVAFCFLRIRCHIATWKMFLYCLIILQVVTSIVVNYFQFSLFKPLRANWDASTPDAKCASPQTAQTAIFVSLAIIIFTDMTFSLLLVSLLADDRPSHEKVAICSIISVWLLATCASIYKTALVKNFEVGGDMFVNGVGVTICTNLEMQFGIIASSVPCLKRPLEKMLRWLGLLKKDSLQGSVIPGQTDALQTGQAEEIRHPELEAAVESGQSAVMDSEKTKVQDVI